MEGDLKGAHAEALMAKNAVLNLDKRTREIFLRSWNQWIEELEEKLATARTVNEDRQ